MTPAQRHDLIMRLQRPLDEVFPPAMARRMRRIRLTVMTGSCIVLIPWVVYLGFTLPENYTAHNWPATWIGFDGLLVAFMATTAVLGWLRRQLVLLTAFTTVLGLAPLLLDVFFQSMAVVIMFGLGFATILTLLVLPVIYACFHRKDEAKQQ